MDQIHKQNFLTELSALQEKYAVQVIAQLDTVVEKLGTATLVKPVAKLMIVSDEQSRNGTAPSATMTPTDPGVIPEVVNG